MDTSYRYLQIAFIPYFYAGPIRGLFWALILEPPLWGLVSSKWKEIP